VAPNRGGCIASDRITVDGEPVGFMYRDQPANELDSGWRMMAGDESEDYMDEPSNHEVYDLNTIANYDPDIVPLLDAPIGAEFERSEEGRFVAWIPTIESRVVVGKATGSGARVHVAHPDGTQWLFCAAGGGC
jgi:hypothetical protein